MAAISSNKLDIALQVKNIKETAVNNKRSYNEFLNKFILVDENRLNINNWITSEIWKFEKNIDLIRVPNYTYWLSGGNSWQEIFNIATKYTEEEEISISIGNYSLNYIYINNQELEEKIGIYYKLLLSLQELLLRKGIETRIDMNNIEYDETSRTLKFNYEEYVYKEPSFYMKLIIVLPEVSKEGGAKYRRRINKKNNYLGKKALYNEYLKLIKENELDKDLMEKIEIKQEFNDKIIIEVNFNYYRETSKFNYIKLNKFNDNYIDKPKIKYEGFNLGIIKSKLRKLNKIGMLTYSYLSSSNKVQEMGLNVDEYRQRIYIEKDLKNKASLIVSKFEELKKVYLSIFKNTNIYNMFFIDKIDNIILKYSIPNYDIFIDFIEKFFMYIFRPAINSFIVEINEELKTKYGIILFIAGGDAMRRFDFNISATKDIDTKLYIGSVIDHKEEIKEIIAKHIVKLRNYLEENYKSLLRIKTIEIDSYDNKIERILDYSNEYINFNYEENNYSVNLTLPDNKKRKEQHFRVREIKSSQNFPVDLYSIDFQTYMNVNDTEQKKISISLLDIVVQNEILKDYYYDTFDNIPVASIKFLIEDLEKTYTTSERALGRIAVGKYKKDIIRYNKLLKEDLKEDLKEPKKRSSISKNKVLIQKLRDELDNIISDEDIKRIFWIILYKLENNYEFTIFDIILSSKILKITNEIEKNDKRFKEEYKSILNLISKISSFNINILNENLNKKLDNYNTYNVNDNFINKNYLELFLNFIKTNDNKQKHIISFINDTILYEIKNRLKIEKPSSSIKRKLSPPEVLHPDLPVSFTSSKRR